MWRCAKCNFLHLENEKPVNCTICKGEKFIEVLLVDWQTLERNQEEVQVESR